MEVFEMLSEKDKPILVIFNFKFRFHKKLANNIEKWCCSKKNCKSFFKRYNKEILKNESKCDVNDHNHEADTEPILKRQKLRNGIKRIATENICERPSKLIHGAFKESGMLIVTIIVILHILQYIMLWYNILPGIKNFTTTDVSCIRKGIYNARKKILPAKPTDIHELLCCIDVKIIEGEQILLINDNIKNCILLSCETNYI